MRELNLFETDFIVGGVWCTYNGERCSNCANMILIDGDDCSIIKGTLHVKERKVDFNSFPTGFALSWIGAVVGGSTSRILGLGFVGGAAVGLAFSVALMTAYTLSQGR